jgi:hypothetical protein
MMPGERARAPQNCPAITKDDTKPIPTVTRWLHFFAPEVQSSKLGRPRLPAYYLVPAKSKKYQIILQIAGECREKRTDRPKSEGPEVLAPGLGIPKLLSYRTATRVLLLELSLACSS